MTVKVHFINEAGDMETLSFRKEEVAEAAKAGIEESDTLEFYDIDYIEDSESNTSDYHIFLEAEKPVTIFNPDAAIMKEEYYSDLIETSVVPESVYLRTVSFYAHGTLEEVKKEAREKCEQLENIEGMGGIPWNFTEDNIYKIE